MTDPNEHPADADRSGGTACYQDFPQPAIVRFDPESDPETAAVFREPVDRTLYLLWRMGHIVDQHFCNYVQIVAKNIRDRKPATVDELAACFPTRHGTHSYWTVADVRAFCERALQYFTGECSCEYEVRLSR